MNQLDLNGQVMAITGGARGIGLAIAKRAIASGAKVALWDADPEAAKAAAAALGANALAVACNVADEKAVAAALKATEAKFGFVSILVANAGITGPNATVETYPADAWRQVMEVNITGVFLCNKAVIPGMKARKYGRIVNIASVAGKEGNPNASAYSTSKAGVIALTKSLGKELAATEIRVNCITPAAIETDIFKQMTKEHIAFMLSKIPMGRFGTVEEAASLACWLASPDCSFSTGAVFDLSGGRATY